MTKANLTKSNGLSNQSEASPPVALFDLDYTLITSDCTAHWLRFLLTRNTVRKILVLACIPLIKLLALAKIDLAKRNSIYLWAATIGLSNADYVKLRRQAADYVIDKNKVSAYPEGLERIRWHKSQGHTVIVITGALRWLARDVCRSLNIQYDYLLGSSERNWGGGRVSDVFCYHRNKVTLLNELNLLTAGNAAYGYSDSAADIPMLDICEHVYIVNPKLDCRLKFERAFGVKATLLAWKA